jgi:hypothetical protein
LPAQGACRCRTLRIVLLTLLVIAGVTVPGTAHSWADGPELGQNCPATAAGSQGWGPGNRATNFDDTQALTEWEIYDGPGHRRNGRRTPGAVSIANGLLTITGNPSGDSGGMAWLTGQMFGRWEACVKSPAAAPGYESLLLLWPDANDWPVGGEIDFVEIADSARQKVDAFLHYGPNDQWETGAVAIDATQWHSWAVEWNPFGITTYVDGVPWWHTPNWGQFPPRPLHLCIQLDNVGGDINQGGQLMVDWVRQYPLL